jgi:cellulose biosynthesis protein BcsQ
MRNTPGQIATFYSYKGGTGRSMALANFAWILAASGKRVLAIDWDLEAPGLHRYFRPFLADPDLFETDGLIDMFWNLTVSAVRGAEVRKFNTVGASDRTPQSAKTLSVTENGDAVIEALEDATRRLDSKFFPPNGCLDFIGAGKQSPTYSERVNSFDWKRFYDLGGARMLEVAKQYFRENYDWVLIDSRTGVSDTSGICTIQMPKTVVAFFTLNRQSIEGLAAILKSIREYRSPTVDGSKIEFFPVATRIENAEKRKLEMARLYARRTLADYLPQGVANKRDYWDRMEIAYRPAYAFEEILAAFGDATGEAGSSDTMLTQVELTSQQITGDSNLRMAEIVEQDREEILTKYALGTLSPSTADEAADTDFLRDIRSKEQLWRTSKFRWRLLMSRRELDLLTEEDRKGFGRNMQYYLIQSERMHKLLRIGQIVGSSVFIFVLVALVALALIDGIGYGISYLWSYIRYYPASAIRYTLSGVSIAWVLSFAARVVVGTVRDKPEGVGLAQILSISKFGPIGIRVPDYTPKEKLRPETNGG